MAWTAPSTWSNGSVVTDTQLNQQLRDNMLYLKASPTFDGGVNVGTATGAGTGQLKVKGYTSFESLSAESAYTGGTFLELNNTSASARNFWIGSTGSGSGAGVGKLVFYDSTAGLFRGAMDSSGNFGFGTTSPAGRLHATGSQGGVVLLSAAAVAGSVVTLATALCAAGAVFYIVDQNNTSGTVVIGTTGGQLQLSGSATYTNTDTITYAITAGGNITVQRTAGTNGTHDINMWVFYF